MLESLNEEVTVVTWTASFAPSMGTLARTLERHLADARGGEEGAEVRHHLRGAEQRRVRVGAAERLAHNEPRRGPGHPAQAGHRHPEEEGGPGAQPSPGRVCQ